MSGSAASLAALTEEIKILPKLVGETGARISAPQRQKFESRVNKIVNDSLKKIGGNVTDFEVGKLIKIRKKITDAAEWGESPKAASRHLVNLLSLIEERLDPEQKSKLQPRVIRVVSNCIASLTEQVDKLDLGGGAEIKKDWYALQKNIVGLLRRLEFLNADDEKEFIATLWWLSQQGQSKDLDNISQEKIRPRFPSKEVSSALSEAEKGIIKNNLQELLGFFHLSPGQLAQAVEAAIRKGSAVTSPQLKRAFGVERPTQVIKLMREIKQILEERIEPQMVKSWLGTPLEVFGGKSPREALIEGKTFPVLHLLRRLDEGSHY